MLVEIQDRVVCDDNMSQCCVFPPPKRNAESSRSSTRSDCCTMAFHLFVADHLCAAFAVVEVVGDAHHAHGSDVVGGGGFN